MDLAKGAATRQCLAMADTRPRLGGTTSIPAGTAPATLPAPGTYAIDPTRSTISFTTRHLFGLAGVAGTFALRSGSLQIAEPATASTATAVFDATSFSTPSAKRDKDVRSAKFLDTDNNPDITFISTALRQVGAQWELNGTLTAHGTAAPTMLAVREVTTEGDEVVLRASTVVDRYAHNVTAAKGMAGRRIDLELMIVAHHA